MTEKMIENRVKKLQAIEAQQKELEAQADAIRAELKADLEATAAYIVQPPTPVSFPTNCCGQFNGWGNNGCGNCGSC